LDTNDHLVQARENLGQADALMAQATPGGYRWAVIVYFYAANEFGHAILDHLKHELPPNPTITTRGGRRVPTILAHPRAHGSWPGGTAYSLARLAEIHPELQLCCQLLDELLQESFSARYGLNRRTIKQYTPANAQASAAQVAEFQRVIGRFLDPS
jgi:hypothetical protein